MTALTNTSAATAEPPTPETAPQTATPETAVAPTALHSPVIDWFTENARDLPWRRPEAGPWGVMVSEFMLQQTPVNRVLPVYEQWLSRWP
ncbi:A/G-specific adenine glycosylase, partial [Streptomyces sp. NPDC001759]